MACRLTDRRPRREGAVCERAIGYRARKGWDMNGESGSSWWQNRRTRGRWAGRSGIVVLIAGLSLVALMAGCGDDSEEVTMASGTPTVAAGAPDTITVSGKGTVTSAPDEAVLTLTVESDGADPAAALDANSQATAQVTQRLKAEGVEDSAIETSNVSLYPIRTYDPDTGKESLTGYRAANTITVTLKDALVVGKVLAASVEAGVTNVSGPVWRLAEDSAAVTEALKKAVTNAQGKAEALASAQGVKVGQVITITEGSVDQPVVPMYSDMYAEEAAGGSKVADVPISPANLDVTATVTITYVLTR